MADGTVVYTQLKEWVDSEILVQKQKDQIKNNLEVQIAVPVLVMYTRVKEWVDYDILVREQEEHVTC